MSKPQKKTWIVISIAVAIALTVIVWRLARPHWSVKELLTEAQAAIERGEFSRAADLARQALKVEPKSADALMIAGETASKLKEPNKAFNYFAQITADEPKRYIDARAKCAQLKAELGDSVESEKYWCEVLTHDPNHVAATESLAFMYRVSGRTWELTPLIERLLNQEVWRGENLISLTTDRVWVKNSEFSLIDHFRQRKADDPIPAMWQACEWQRLGKNEDAIQLFKEVTQFYPKLIEPQARLGTCLSIVGTNREILEWLQQLPSEMESHPEAWYVRGLWQRKHKQWPESARCFWEALSRNPNHRAASYQLAQVLVELKRPNVADEFAKHAQKLSNLKVQSESATGGQSYVPAVVELLESMGRFTEAIGWCQSILVSEVETRKPWAKEAVARLQAARGDSTKLVHPAFNLALKHDLSNYPLPNWNSAESLIDDDAEISNSKSQIQFVDLASDAKLNFSYFNGADPKLDLAYMFEFSGGGIGVVDFNNDGWPDIYLTQGCAWPVDQQQRQHTNRLFLNLGDGSFQDVSQPSHSDDGGFGQGVAVGDFNNDGFQDIYVANIGINRLYQNNGDGTYSLVDDPEVNSSRVENCWTISSVMADFNGDAIPDIYDVNYLGGPEVYVKVCKDKDQPIQCFPPDFPAEQDRILTSLGDGRFEDSTKESGIILDDGKGMGIVAADFNDSGKLSLVIANDTTSNFFFVNQTEEHSKPKFRDDALLAGLALDTNGFANSCMGIAAGDADGNKLLDLFVTNFREEANNFFFQRPGLQFDDRIIEANLHDPGFMLEGWGVQFIDGDLDGQLDLVVANGHLDDYPSAKGQSSHSKKMPAQFFRNLGQGRFQVADPQTIGPYFRENHLGRAIARIDWNRDGREDFGITHVDAPVALMTNHTEQAGHYLAIRLTGVTKSRDAIGTTVTVEAGDEIWTRQLMAGDGFSASNQRVLIFGLGDVENIDTVSVQWTPNRKQVHRNVDVDTELMIIEGHSTVFTLAKSTH